MQRMVRDVLRITSFVLFCSIASFLFTFIQAEALESAPATGLPCDDPREPTANEIAAGAPAGLKGCPQDFAITTDESGAAKQYLRSIFTGSGSSGCSGRTPDSDKIGKLNPTFAICAAKFLQGVRRVDPSITITSAYRTTNHQACICGGGRTGCAAPGRSNHQQGLALDLRARNYAWLHAQIRSFGGLRHLTIANDPYHMEAIKGGPCMQAGYRPSDFSPVPYAASPSSGLADYTRQLFGLNTSNPYGQVDQNCTLPGGAVVPCSAIANQGAQQQPTISPIPGTQQGGGSQGTQTATPISGTSLDLSGEGTEEDTSDAYDIETGSPATKTLTETILDTISKTNTSLNTSTKKLSTLEQLRIFAQGTTSTKVPQSTTTVPLVLVIDESDAVSIEAQVPDATIIPQGTTSEYIPFTSQQTFTSQNLGTDGFAYAPPPSQTTFGPYQQVLINMQGIVSNMIAYLRPFGRPIEHSHTDEYSEEVE